MTILLNLVNSLNNAFLLNFSKIYIKKFNTLSLNTLQLFQELNIIDSFLLNLDQQICIVFLKKNKKTLNKIINISKPSRFIYYNLNELMKLRSVDLFNNYIVSINSEKNTIVTIDTAISLHKGGLLLFKIVKN